MTPEQEAAKKAADKQAEDEAAKKAAEDPANPPQDPLKVEAEKIKKGKEGRTELEKARYTKAQIDARIKELEKETGVVAPVGQDDDKPVTVGDLKRIEEEKAQQTALSLAQQIPDETERSLVIHHLEVSVRPSGDPVADLAKARAIVNEVKNRQIAEEATRRQNPQRNSKGSGAPGSGEPTFEPSADEAKFMRPPYNLSKEKILEARKAAQKSE